MHAAGQRDLECVDVFSASEKVKTAFTKRDRRAECFDIQGNAAHDITLRSGFIILLVLGLRPLDLNGMKGLGMSGFEGLSIGVGLGWFGDVSSG